MWNFLFKFWSIFAQFIQRTAVPFTAFSQIIRIENAKGKKKTKKDRGWNKEYLLEIWIQYVSQV